MVSDEEEFAAGVGERAEAKCSSVVSVLDGSAHDSSEKRLITFYKRAIVFRPQPHDQSDRDHSYQRQSPSHLPGHKDADGDDDVIGRPFEFVLVHDEIAKMIESNGFYKFLIKNPIDSNALGLWIFCPLVFIHHDRQVNPKQKLKRSKIMWVFLDGNDPSDYHHKMTIFENGANLKPAQPLGSFASSFDPNHHHYHRRIGEMNLPIDHFELLIERLKLNSIYSIGRRGHPHGQSQDDELSLLSRDYHLSTSSSSAHQDPDDDLFQGIYRVSYLWIPLSS